MVNITFTVNFSSFALINYVKFSNKLNQKKKSNKKNKEISGLTLNDQFAWVGKKHDTTKNIKTAEAFFN